MENIESDKQKIAFIEQFESIEFRKSKISLMTNDWDECASESIEKWEKQFQFLRVRLLLN